LTASYYVDEAERLTLPIPNEEDPDYWKESKFSHMQQLTVKGVAELRSAIRKEQKERWEHWQMRLTLLIGFMGTLIGLVSLLVKK
jgi:hypothetical protein